MLKHLVRAFIMYHAVVGQCLNQIVQSTDASTQLGVTLQDAGPTSLYYNPAVVETVSNGNVDVESQSDHALTLVGDSHYLADIVQQQGLGINAPLTFAEDDFRPQFNLSLLNSVTTSLFTALEGGLAINYPPYDLQLLTSEKMQELMLGNLSVMDYNDNDIFQINILSTPPPECEEAIHIRPTAPHSLTRSPDSNAVFPCDVNLQVVDKGGQQLNKTLRLTLDNNNSSNELLIPLVVSLGGGCCIGMTVLLVIASYVKRTAVKDNLQKISMFFGGSARHDSIELSTIRNSK